jgi:hypothetical protein
MGVKKDDKDVIGTIGCGALFNRFRKSGGKTCRGDAVKVGKKR